MEAQQDPALAGVVRGISGVSGVPGMIVGCLRRISPQTTRDQGSTDARGDGRGWRYRSERSRSRRRPTDCLARTTTCHESHAPNSTTNTYMTTRPMGPELPPLIWSDYPEPGTAQLCERAEART